MMKILHVVSALDKLCGGTSEVVPRMCEELVARGHDVTILTLLWTLPAESAERAVSNGVKIKYCHRNRTPILKSLGYSSEFAHELKRLVRQVDVMHLHGLWQWPCWIAASEAMHARRPYIMQTHGFLEPERLKKSAFVKKIVGNMIELPRLNSASRIVATADSEKDGILKYNVDAPVEVVPIGIDTMNIDSAERDPSILRRFGVPANKKVLLFLSRLAPIKGLDMLAKAWIRLQDFHNEWHLLIVGEDTQGFSDVIKRYYAECITDNSVSMPGPIYGYEKFRLLKSVNAFVLPTRSENFSIAVLEALAAGLPVVCTKGAPWSVIERYGAGRWVDIDVDAIANGLRYIMSGNESDRCKMGEAGRSIAKINYSWTAVTSKLIKIYDAIKKE